MLFTKVVRKGTSGSRPASESVPLYISVNSECASSWHRQTCQTVLKVYQPFRRYVRRGCDWLRSGFIWTGFVWRFPETLYEASVIYICLSVSFGSHFNETGQFYTHISGHFGFSKSKLPSNLHINLFYIPSPIQNTCYLLFSLNSFNSKPIRH